MANPGGIGPACLTAVVTFLGSYGLQCAQRPGTGHMASVSMHMTREGLCVNGCFYQQHRGAQHSPSGQQGRPPSKPKSAFPQLAATAFHTRAVRFPNVSCSPLFDVMGDFPVAGGDLCPERYLFPVSPCGLCILFLRVDSVHRSIS